MELLERSKRSLAGGVSSNVRASLKPHPLFFAKAKGALLWDVDGNEYIDYVLGQGPLILGHSHPGVMDSVGVALKQGQIFGGQHELEIQVAEALVKHIPCAQLCRFSLSGSEIIHAAVRLARAATERRCVVKFEGHYHGWLDSVLINIATPLEKGGDRESPLVVPASRGQAPGSHQDWLVLPWNDLERVEALFSRMGNSIAAVLTEPIMCNSGGIMPREGFLEGLASICRSHGSLLIMDEIITGFRVGLGGAQDLFGVVPDLATFGKAMAGGLPCSALVGRADLLELFTRDVNHSGTFNSNVASMAASAATIGELESDDGAVYERLEQLGCELMQGIREVGIRKGVPLLVQGPPAAFHVAFTCASEIHDYRDQARHADRTLYGRFALSMLRQGIRLSDLGIWFLSAAHTRQQVARTLEAVGIALDEIKR